MSIDYTTVGDNSTIGPGTPSINDNFDPTNLIPGAKDVLKMLQGFDKVASQTLNGFLQAASLGDAGYQASWVRWLEHTAKILERDLVKNPEDILQGGQLDLLTAMLEHGLGVSTKDFHPAAKKALQMTAGMYGFALSMAIGAIGLASVGKMLFADRFGEIISETIKSIPETFGLSWTLGSFMGSVLDAAVGDLINEGLRSQTRPSRLEWPVLKQLVHQHVINDSELVDALQMLGYPDNIIKMIQDYSITKIPVGDLQSLWLYDLIDRSGVVKGIEDLGFNNKDSEQLAKLYIDKAQTSAGSVYRDTARELLRNQLITSQQYITIAQQTNMPPREIKDTVAAVAFEQNAGHLHTSITALKGLYQQQKIGKEEVLKNLRQIGYSEEGANLLIKEWELPRKVVEHGLTTAQVLSYFLSGIISKSNAYDHLINNHLRAQDAEFLLDHPTAQHGVHLKKLSPGLVQQAVLDGAITLDQVPDALKKANVDDSVIPYYENVIKFRLSRLRRPAGSSIPLAPAQILDAFAFGLWDEDTSVNALMHLGYSHDDAILLVEIKNKGPIQPQGTPLFSNLEQAIEYLQSKGFRIFPPADPHLEAAEAMVTAAGYTYEPPLNIPPIPPLPPPLPNG